MPNLRIVAVNAADTATVASPGAVLPVTNLQNTTRTSVWRASGTAATITAAWADPQALDSVALMTSNLTSAATWRIRAFDAAVMLYDSSAVLACPPRPLGELDWGYRPLGVNAFAFGMAAQSVLWVAERVLATSVVIDIDDATNPAGYIEASRLVIGERWEPEYNMSWGAQLTFEERGSQSRADDGTLRSEPGAVSRTLEFSLDWLKELDRAAFAEITRYLGIHRDFLISAYPASSADKDAHYTMQAKLTRAPGIKSVRYANAAQVTCAEI